jgi:N6-L-threonylcarbamoyladenine synthase
VVPEVVARSHIEAVIPVIHQAVDGSGFGWDDIDGIAVTNGAGLLGSLLIGVLAARTLAISKQKPLYAINHVEAHLYANFLTETALTDYKMRSEQPEFPILGLITSGNHSQLVIFQDHFDYMLLGQTYDDAIGEAFDKVARLIGIPYPGGVPLSKLAESGNPNAFKLPKARMAGRYDFSFSGIKTAVLRLAQEQAGADYTLSSLELPARLTQEQKADIAASFQRVACETIVDKAVLAFEEFQPKSVIIGGGVAANSELRRQLAERIPIEVEYPDIKLCGDNGAMVATLGCFKAERGLTTDPFTLEAIPNLTM